MAFGSVPVFFFARYRLTTITRNNSTRTYAERYVFMHVVNLKMNYLAFILLKKKVSTR